MHGRLPRLDPEALKCHLEQDCDVQVVDLLDIGRSRDSQLTALAAETQRPETRTITSIEGDDEPEHAEQRTNSSAVRTVRFTVRDAAGSMAYMLPLDNVASLRLGAHCVLLKGTEIWRSVLVPRANQVVSIRGGSDLNAAQRQLRLTS